jgi:hypothetical protein
MSDGQSLSDETALLNLFDDKVAGGHGANFKTPTFTAAAAVVEASRTKGGPYARIMEFGAYFFFPDYIMFQCFSWLCHIFRAI